MISEMKKRMGLFVSSSLGKYGGLTGKCSTIRSSSWSMLKPCSALMGATVARGIFDCQYAIRSPT